MNVSNYGVRNLCQRSTRLVVTAIGRFQQDSLIAIYIQRVTVITADIAVQLRSSRLCSCHRQSVAALCDIHSADIASKTKLRKCAVRVCDGSTILTAVPCQLNRICIRKLALILYGKTGNGSMRHNPINDHIIGSCNTIASVVKQARTGAVVQCIGICRVSEITYELPNDGLCCQLSTIRMDVSEAICAAIAIRHGQCDGISLVCPQAAPAYRGIGKTSACRTDTWFHAVSGDSAAATRWGEVFQLCAGITAPTGDRRLVFVVAIFIAAADGACNSGGMGCNDGQPHNCHQQTYQRQKFRKDSSHRVPFSPAQRATVFFGFPLSEHLFEVFCCWSRLAIDSQGSAIVVSRMSVLN